MIYIYTTLGKNSELTLSSIEAMMKSVHIESKSFKVHDIAEKIIIGNNLNLIAFGKKAVIAVVNALITEGYIQKGVYKGSPLIDEKSGFFFYGIHLEISEIMGDDQNKFFVYEHLSDMSSYHKKWTPFEDEIPDFIQEGIIPDTMTKIETEIADAPPSIGLSEGKVLSSLELINTLIEKVDFSDVGLGKSLSKFEKIQLVTASGYKFNILPTVRENSISNPDEINISYKDVLSLLKVVVLTGSPTIEFFEDNICHK